MNKPQPKRIVNRNLLYSKMAERGLTLTSLGKMLVPPVGRIRAFQIVDQGKPDYRLHEIAAILDTNIQTVFPKLNKEDGPGAE
jgi:hypothetical protein